MASSNVGTEGEIAGWRDFMRRIQDCDVVVAVIGLGYVGLPLALTIAERGIKCIGYDIDATKISHLRNGASYIDHISAERIQKTLCRGSFELIDDVKGLARSDAILVCVPTPLDRSRQPDLSFVINTMREVARHLKPGQLVVLESTTYPGTTSDVVSPILEESGLTTGEDFLLAYSPEREDPGNESYTTGQIPKIVGADDARSLEIVTGAKGRAWGRGDLAWV